MYVTRSVQGGAPCVLRIEEERMKMKAEWKTLFRIGISVFLLYLCITYWATVAGLIHTVFHAATPLFVGAVLAYLLNILMSFYEKHYFTKYADRKIVKKSKRAVCVTAAIITCLGIVTLVLWLVIPQFVACIKLLVMNIPPAINRLLDNTRVVELLPDNMIDFLANTDWQSYLSKAFHIVTSGVGDVMNFTVSFVSGTLSTMATVFISIIFTVYLLCAKDNLKRQFTKLAVTYLKPVVKEKLFYVTGVFHDCFHRYIVGQCIEAVILGTLCTIGMWIFRLPYATMIGALVAVTALVPVAGAYIGGIVGGIMILTVAPGKTVLFVIFLVVLQQIEGNLIYPRVVGSSVGLPGLWVLAAVTIGGGLFGIVGMLIGVPLAAAVYQLVRTDVKKREKRLL